MDRGTYVAASGGLLQFRKLEVVNNNLANVNTPGFKKQMLEGDQQSFDVTFARLVEGEDPYARPDHQRTPGAVHIRTVTDFSPGPINATGNSLDVALRNPKDFFVVQAPDGPQYTRAGNFSLGTGGQLVAPDGLPVQGDGGAITIDKGIPIINPDGSVRVDGQTIGRLQVVRVEDPKSLERVGATRFKVRGGSAAPADVDADLVPNALEMSNVGTISSVIDLIGANRGFQMYTKVAETIDAMNQTSISQYGTRR